MPTLEEVKQQLLEARQQTEQRKQEVSEAEYQLEKARTSLPQYQSQEAIRKLSREQRRGISQAVKSIEQKRAEIGEYGKEIKKFETEELSPSEYQVQKYEEETRALETASKLFEHKVVPSSKPSFGVMHACQISSLAVSCCTITFVWFRYNAWICCDDNELL